MNETLVNVGQATSKKWKDKTNITPKEAYVAGLTTGLKNSKQQGPWFFIVYSGGKDGIVEGANLIFLSQKASANFHSSIQFELKHNELN